MKHLNKYKQFEAAVQDITFSRYYDKMSKDDELRLDKILEKDPSEWSDEDKKFMDKMSMKNRKLFIGSDKKIYTENDIKNMGLNPDEVGKKDETRIKNPQLANQVNSLISVYREALKEAKKFVDSNQYEMEILPIVKQNIKNLEESIEKLKEIIK